MKERRETSAVDIKLINKQCKQNNEFSIILYFNDNDDVYDNAIMMIKDRKEGMIEVVSLDDLQSQTR